MSAVSIDQVLIKAQELGFIGPRPPQEQLDHAVACSNLVINGHSLVAEKVNFLDLGSGGGLPGLVLALMAPNWQGCLLDAQERRTQFLQEAILDLNLGDRLVVVRERAEVAARMDQYRGQFSLVVARSFASPPVTAECAVGFLTIGGRLVVSEPVSSSGDAPRWPENGLGLLGFGSAEIVSGGGASIATVKLLNKDDDRWPRRTGIPAKRPLW